MGPAEQLQEQVLVVRFQAGDAAAFTALVERHHASLCYFINRFGVAGQAADDIAQEVWLSAYRRLGTLREPAAFRTWLYRIARNRVLQDARGRKEEGPLPHDLPASDDASQDGFSKDKAEAIHRCLPLLRPEHREVLLLRFLEEMSYEEIAVVTGAELGTVRSRLHYAKMALRARIEEEDHAS